MTVKHHGSPEDKVPELIFSEDYKVKFRTAREHPREIWRAWGFTVSTGAYIGISWVIVTHFGPDNGASGGPDSLDRYLSQTLGRLSLDFASKVLAVVATLIVAITVIVRALSDPSDPNTQAIDLVRRSILTRATKALAAAGVTASFIAAASDFGSDNWGLPGAVGLLLLSAVIALIAADATTILGRARSSDPRFDAWWRQEKAATLEARGLKWADSRHDSEPTGNWNLAVQCAAWLAFWTVVIMVGITASSEPLGLDLSSLTYHLWRSLLFMLVIGTMLLFSIVLICRGIGFQQPLITSMGVVGIVLIMSALWITALRTPTRSTPDPATHTQNLWIVLASSLFVAATIAPNLLRSSSRLIRVYPQIRQWTGRSLIDTAESARRTNVQVYQELLANDGQIKLGQPCFVAHQGEPHA